MSDEIDALLRRRAHRVGPEPEHDEIVGRALSFPGPAVYDRKDLEAVAVSRFSEPGRAPVTAAGPRAPRPASTTLAADATIRHNWTSIGPRNIAGRIRALACADPTVADPTTWYAGSAGGGVWKTTNGGRRWTALWHDQPCLEIGAIAIAPSNAQRVYVATGEAVPGSYIAIRSFGVFVSGDAGATWDNHGAGAPHPVAPRGFEAIAVDPVDERHCWVVGPDGAFRTIDAGQHWEQLDPGVNYTDVAFTANRLFLVRGASRGGEGAVVRLTTPLAAITTATLRDAANTSVVVAPIAAHLPWPVSGKIAVAPSNPSVAYVHWTGEDDYSIGIFRSVNANAANVATMAWTRLPGHPAMPEEEQGSYDLCISVDPTDPSNVVTAQQLFVFRSTNADTATAADVTWQRILSWELRNEGLDGHQSDHHDLAFAGNPPQLWLASDGGIARSLDWRTGAVPTHGQRFRPDPVRPAPPGAVRWEKRDYGISGAQFYDLAQHPLVPTVVAGGLQDNGTVLRPGGLTWQRVFIADGGHVGFDPDDPYRFDLSYFAGLVSLQFPALLDRLFADGVRDVDALTFRFLTVDVTDDGPDPPPHVPETERHPRRTGRLLHARKGRLWGLQPGRGERLTEESLGRSFELQFFRPPAPPPPPPRPPTDFTIADTPGAWRLGLVPGRVVRPDRSRVTIYSRLSAPYVLTEGDTLTITVNGTAFTVTFTAAAGVNPASLSVADVIRLFGPPAVPAAIIDQVKIKPYVWGTPSAVLLIAGDSGPTSPREIRLGGSALAAQPDGLSRLGLNPGTYVGDAHGASVLLGFSGLDSREREINRDLRGGLQLEVAVNGRAAVNVALGGFADPQHATTGEIAAVLRAGLAAEPIEVRAVPVLQSVLLRADPGRRVVLSGTAADRLGIGPHGSTAVALGSGTLVSLHAGAHVRNRSSVDLTPAPPAGAPLELVIGDGTAAAAPLRFTAANVAALRSVTVEELHRLISAHLALHPAVLVRAELRPFPLPGAVSEIRFSPAHDDHIWVGLPDGSVFRTVDDGITWTDVTDAAMRTMDRQVEAIVCHPTDPLTVYVGLVGEAFSTTDPGFLFKTVDAGATPWQQVGFTVVGGVATGIVSDGRPLGINALELDPRNPDVVYAGTDAGVFRSSDAGVTWSPFGEGLPNAPVIDLAVEPTEHVLRAAMWTRGVYERRLDTAAPDDVRLVIRASDHDDGHRPARAAPSFHRGAPEPLLGDSPDIKHVRRRPAVGTDAELDGVAFDLVVPHDDVVRGGAAEVLVQVTNAGALATSAGDEVRVVALWAPVDGGVPPLPADIWMRITAGALADPVGGWTLLGDGQVARPVGSGDTAVRTFPVNWPALAGVQRIGIVALATAAADPIAAGPLDVGVLVGVERRAAYREIRVHSDDDDRTLLLRATGPHPIVVDQAAPPEGTGVADRLGFAAADIGAGGLVRVAAPAAGPTYALAVALPAPGPAIVLRTAAPIAADLVMLPAAGEVGDVTAVEHFELAEMINRRAAALGLPIEALDPGVGVAIVAEAGVTMRVTGGAAAPRLGLAVGGVAADFVLTNQTVAWFNLTGAAALNLEFLLPGAANVAVAVNLAAARFPDPAVADPSIIATIIDEALAAARLSSLVSAFATNSIAVRGRGSATLALSGPAAAAGVIGFPAPAASVVIAIPGPVDLTPGPILHVDVTPRVVVRFDGDPADIPDLANATPGDVRRAINVACEVASVPVVAEVPRVDLRVAASPGDVGRTHTVSGGAHLAELAVLAVGQAASPDVFTVRAALGVDKLARGVNNQLALRVRNVGNIACATTRLRVLQVNTSVEPLVTNEIASVVVSVDPGASHIETLQWDPAGAAPRTETLLVVADDNRAGRETVVPPLNVFADLFTFAASARGVALRAFEVVDP